MSSHMKQLRETAKLRMYARTTRIPQKKSTDAPIDASNYKDRLPVGMACIIEQAARAAYEAVRLINVQAGDEYPPFNENKRRADGYINNALQFFMDPPANECVQHNRWCDAKMADGWEWGETLDMDKKTHPDLVPYIELSDTALAKGCAVLGIHRAIINPFISKEQPR